MIGLNGETLEIELKSRRAGAPSRVRVYYPTAMQQSRIWQSTRRPPLTMIDENETRPLIEALRPLLADTTIEDLMEHLTWIELVGLAMEIVVQTALSEDDKKKSEWQSSAMKGGSVQDAPAAAGAANSSRSS